MGDDFLSDPARTPDAVALRERLGSASRYWDELLAQARTALPAVSRESAWKYYVSSRAWRYLVRHRRRTLVHLAPGAGRFTAAFPIRDDEVANARPRLPAAAARLVRGSPSFAEGRAVRVVVATSHDARLASRFLALKTAAAAAP
jgi:hypothetical protein